jgi:hypothetical protein
MTTNPFLQHLIPDPTFGYLFAHRLAIAAFGVPNEYQLNKHRPRLVEGQHYIKIRGNDHVERLFYTLTGLLALSDLVGTPHAQQFKQALVQHTQSGGAIVPAQPSTLYQPTVNTPAYPYAEPVVTQSCQDFSPTPGYPITPWHDPNPVVPNHATASASPADPAYLVAQYLQSPIEQAIDRAVAARVPMAPVSPLQYQTPQDTASIIFEAQRLAGEQARRTAETVLTAQSLITDQEPNRWNTWLSTQDTWAMSLIAAAIIALAGIGSYFFVALAVRPTPPTQNYSIQTQP